MMIFLRMQFKVKMGKFSEWKLLQNGNYFCCFGLDMEEIDGRWLVISIDMGEILMK